MKRMHATASLVMRMVAFLLAAARLVSSQCTAGSILTAAGEPLSGDGAQYINLDNPTQCRGNITAWHLCYYPRASDNSFTVHFRVWRPEGNSFSRLLDDERTFTTSGSNGGELVCEDITLSTEDYVRIEHDDVIGIYIPSSSTVSTVGVFESSPGPGVGIYRDGRNSIPTRVRSSVDRDDLIMLRTAGLHLYTDITPASPPLQSSTNSPTTASNLPSPSTPSSPDPSTSQPQPPDIGMPMTEDESLSFTSTQRPNIASNTNEQTRNDDGSNINDSASKGSQKGGVVAAVVIVLLLIGAGVVVAVVVLVLYLRKRNKSLTCCFKGRGNGLFGIDNLIYRAGSDRIPFSNGKTPGKYEHPYDIPRDHHNRSLYDIPKNKSATISSSTSNGNASTSEIAASAPSEYQQPNPTVPAIPNGNIYQSPSGLQVNPGAKVRVTSILDDPVYIYMDNNSETTDGDEELGGNHDKTSSEEDTDTNSEAYVAISYDSVEYKRLLKKAADARESDSEGEAHYSTPPSREDEIYIVLSKQRIKVIPREAIEKISFLGSGEFATVDKGIWKGSKGTIDVAVKTLSESANEAEKIRFLQEAVVMGQFVHPNIIQLYGIVTRGDPIMLVLEHMPNGDLKKFLNRIRPEPGQLVPSNTPKLLLGFSQQVALGMHYLASKGFVHRDLAARNIFVSEDNNCKIGDFGMSRDLTDGYYKGHGGKVPLKWTAPEAIRLKKYSIASDVWSYGCLLYEIWSLGRKPFKGISNTEAINKISNGYRLPPPPGCPRVIYELMIQCWHPAPAARPKYREMLTKLLDEEHKVLSIPMEDASSNPQACLLGAPIEEGEKMCRDLQESYLSEFDNKHNPDYEYVETDHEDL